VRLQLHKRPKYYLSFGLIFLLALFVSLAGLFGVFGVFGEAASQPRDFALLALLCLICGLQNATITAVSRSVIRTTHLTGITTDLGIGLARVLNRGKLPGLIDDEVKANLMRFGIIVFFGLGSVAGGIIFRRFEYGGFLVPVITSGTLFGAMLYFQVLRPPGSKPSGSRP
jgi:uncharacterized membrane protein YoaK (UPF0700 family)